jgi:hypothetical protein
MPPRETLIHQLLVAYDAKLSDMDDDALVDDLAVLRDLRIQSSIDAIGEALATESNESLFGDEDWNNTRQSAIDGFVERRLEQLEALSDEELTEMVAVISTIADAPVEEEVRR